MKPDASGTAALFAKVASPSEDLTGRSRFARNVAFAWGGYVINVIAGFVMPRLISDRLGQSVLGVWDFSWSIVSYFGLVQLGLGGSVDRYVAHYRSKGDREGLSRSVSTIALSLKISGLLAAVLAVITAYWILPLLHKSLGGQLGTARWVVLFLGAEIATLLMLTVYGAVIVGCHRWDIHNSISALTYTAMTCGMVVAIMMGGGLPALALVHCLAFVGGEIARVRTVHRVCPELKMSYRLFCRKTWLEQARFSVKGLVSRIAELLSNQFLAILIAAFLGPAMLAIYSRPRNLLRQIQTLAAKFGFILIPTASSLQALEDKANLRTTFCDSTFSIACLTIPAVATLAILGDAIIQLWMGPTYIMRGLIAILAVGSFPTFVQEPIWSILTGMNQHGRLAFYKLIGAFCSAVLLWLGLAVFKWNLLGAALAFALPQFLVDGLIAPAIACRRLDVPFAQYCFRTLLKPLSYALPFVCCLLLARLTLAHSPWTALVFGIGGIVALAHIYWITVIPAKMKQAISSRLPSILLSAEEDTLPDLNERSETDVELCPNDLGRVPLPSAPRIFVVFRNDDPSAISDLDHERQIFGLFERYGVPQTLGIIPNVSLLDLHNSRDGYGTRPLFENEAVAGFLKAYVQRTGSEVALHGYTHQTNRHSIPRRREYFEFKRLPVTDQENMLRAGTQILEQVFGSRPVTFIPPWNRWDTNTLAACSRVGCKVISAGPYVPSQNGLVSFGTNTDLLRFENALSEAKQGKGSVFLNVLFHSRTIRSDQEKRLLEKILAVVSRDPACRPVTISQAVVESSRELKFVNLAGQNIVPFHELKNSVRAQAWVYLEFCRILCYKTRAAELQRAAREYYLSGNYAACSRLSGQIDAACRKALWMMRAAALLVGGFTGTIATSSRAMTWLKFLPLHGLIPLSVMTAGVLLALYATAHDTRKELVISALLVAIGVLSVSIVLEHI